MFGIDLGIRVSSISCVTQDRKVLDCCIIFGNKSEEDDWKRIINMTEDIINGVDTICRAQAGTIVMPYVSIEEPVYPWRTRNPKSYFNLTCLYALVRNKFSKRGFKIHSVNPMSAKSTAKHLAFKKKKLKKLYCEKGKLTKKGMIKAFVKITGEQPKYHTLIGKETLADSFFIALTGIDRRKVGVK